MEATSLAEVDTLYSADSIEFCPTPGFEKWFTCGTYQLLKPEEAKPEEAKEEDELTKEVEGLHLKDEDDNDADSIEEEYTPPAPRVGRLYLFSMHDTTPTEVQRIETAAILDAKWSPQPSETPEIAVADAKGGLTLFNLTPTDTSAEFIQRQRLQVADESILVLSLDHAPTQHTARAGEIITSLSNGGLAHLMRDSTGELEVDAEWSAHDFEPWITAWDGVDANTVWSGGDDLKLKRWDVRMNGMPTLVNKRFDGGVTTIAPSPHVPHLLAVGSYDAHLRLFDVRAPQTPLVELELPGGIWRTRWHPSPKRSGDILNACMHGGFAAVHLPQAVVDNKVEGEERIFTTFPGTLGYGADWSRGDDGDKSVVATCSFYDHVMHVWRA